MDNSCSIKTIGVPKIHSPLDAVQFIEDNEYVLLNPVVKILPKEAERFQGISQQQRPATPIPFDTSNKNCFQKAGPRSRIFFDAETVQVGIVTCGGLCPGLNNVIRGIVNCLSYRYGVKKPIYGFRYGYYGIANKDYILLTPEKVKDIHNLGGSYLGSSRGHQDSKVMVDNIIELGIDILVTIGGDGTQKGAHQIFEEVTKRNKQISIIGVPKTVDNDLAYVDRTFGFETAIEQAQAPILAAHQEARSVFNGIGLVKLMGRDSGFIALNASISSGDVNIVLLPEAKFTMEELIEYLIIRFKTSEHCVIVCAEGAGQDILPPTGKTDKSGNTVLQDIGLYLKSEIPKRLAEKNIECKVIYIDPSYQIRCCKANPFDAAYSTILAQMCCHAAMAGKTDMIVGSINNQYVHVPLLKATEYRKKVDKCGTYFQAMLDQTGMPEWLDLIHHKKGEQQPEIASPEPKLASA